MRKKDYLLNDQPVEGKVQKQLALTTYNRINSEQMKLLRKTTLIIIIIEENTYKKYLHDLWLENKFPHIKLIKEITKKSITKFDYIKI